MANILDWLVNIQAGGPGSGRRGHGYYGDKPRRSEDEPGIVPPIYKGKNPEGEERREWGFPRRGSDRPLAADADGPGRCPRCKSMNTAWTGSSRRSAKCKTCGNLGLK